MTLTRFYSIITKDTVQMCYANVESDMTELGTIQSVAVLETVNS